jgi:hypothetical protein
MIQLTNPVSDGQDIPIEKDSNLDLSVNKNVIAIGTEIFRTVKCEGDNVASGALIGGLGFLEKIRQKTGIKVHLIPQDQEGDLGYRKTLKIERDDAMLAHHNIDMIRIIRIVAVRRM